jgi:hypothetical protein
MKQTTKQFVVLSMVGGIDLVGDMLLDGGYNFKLERPCSLSRSAAGEVMLHDMLRGGVLGGEFIEVNRFRVMWSAEPSAQIALAYRSLRSGLVIANDMPASVNG